MHSKEILIIKKCGSANPARRNKKELIERFIDSLSPDSNVDSDWNTFINSKKREEIIQIIYDEKLDEQETIKFINNAFRDGFVQTTGTSLTKVLPPVSRFTQDGERTKKRNTVLQKLKEFFLKFYDLSSEEV